MLLAAAVRAAKRPATTPGSSSGASNVSEAAQSASHGDSSSGGGPAAVRKAFLSKLGRSSFAKTGMDLERLRHLKSFRQASEVVSSSSDQGKIGFNLAALRKVSDAKNLVEKNSVCCFVALVVMEYINHSRKVLVVGWPAVLSPEEVSRETRAEDKRREKTTPTLQQSEAESVG